MSKNKKISIVILCFIGFIFIIYTLFGFLGIPYILKNSIPSSLKKQGIELNIKDAKFNPFTYDLNISEIYISTFEKIFSAKKIDLDIDILKIFKKTIHLNTIKLDTPDINILKDTNGTFNFAAFLPKDEKDENVGQTSSFNFILNRLEISNGKFSYSDNSLDKPFNISLDDINYKISNINMADENIGHHTLDSISNLAKNISIDSGIKIKPLTFHGNIKVQDLELNPVWLSFLENMPLKLKSGKLSTQINYNIIFDKDKMYFLIDNSNLTLNDILVLDKNDSISLGELNIPNINIVSNIKPYDVSTMINFENLNLLNLNHSKIGHIDALNLIQNNLNIALKDKNTILDINSSKIGSKNISFNKDLALSSDDLNASNISFMLQNMDGNLSIDTNLAKLDIKNSQFNIDKIKASLNDAILTNANFTLKDKNITFKNDTLNTADFSFFINKEKLLNNQSSNLSNLTYTFNNQSSIINADSYELSKTTAYSKNSKFSSFEKLNLKDIIFDINDLNLKINTINLDTFDFKTDINKNGKISVIENLPSMQSKNKTSKNNKKQQNSHKKAFSYSINQININNSKANINNIMDDFNVVHKFDDIDIKIKNFTSNYAKPFGISLSSNSKDISLKTSGEVSINPFKTNLNIVLSHRNLPYYMPYAKEFIDAKLQDAKMSFKGRFKFDKTPQIQGNLELKDVSLLNQEDFGIFYIKQFYIKNIQYNTNSLNLDDITLQEPYLNVYIDKNKQVNLSKIIKKDESKNDKQDKKEDQNDSKFAISINKIKLENGTLDFSDYSLFTPFVTKISNLQSTASSIRNDKISHINLEGTVGANGYSSIEIRTKPFDPKDYTKVNMTFKDINLPDATPYSSEFAGYEIDSGRLNLSLVYDINNSVMLSENIINIDALELGKKVQSDQAVNLPLKLAISILKDSNNQITVSLPITGDLSNPKFSYGGIVLQAIMQLFTDIITSPFKFLTSTLGIKGEHMDTIDFKPGNDNLISSEKAKIPNFAKIIEQKDGINITITPAYNKKLDENEFQKNKFESDISRYMMKDGLSYKDALEKLRIRFFPNKNFPSLQETTNAIIATYDIKQKYFDEVAINRAQNIKNALIKAGIPKDRIEILKTNPNGKIKQNLYISVEMGIVRKEK